MGFGHNLGSVDANVIKLTQVCIKKTMNSLNIYLSTKQT